MKLIAAEKTALFIDGTNLFAASRGLGFDIDFRALRNYFEGKTNVLRAYYYVAVLEGEEYSPLKPLTDWLGYNGYTLIKRAAKEFTDSSGRRRVESNMDVEMAVDMLEISDRIDHAVVLSGESHLRRAVEAAQRRGVRVTVISTIRSSPPMASDELRRQADQFVELADIAPEFIRRQTEVRERPPARRQSNSPINDPVDAGQRS